MILDVRVLRDGTPESVAQILAQHLDTEIGADEYGNPAIRLDTGTIVVADDSWDVGVVYAEVRAPAETLADRVYEILEASTPWDIALVDSSDEHPEDVVLRERHTRAA